MLSTQIFLNDAMGRTFLSITPNARAMGMGEAFSAVGDDVSSIYWNIASLSQVEDFSFMLSHYFWGENFAYNYLGMAFPSESGTYGLNAFGFWSLPQQGGDSFSSASKYIAFAIKFGFGYSVSEFFSFGVGTKLIYQKIYFIQFTGFAADIGLFLNITKDFKFGYSLKDLNLMIASGSDAGESYCSHIFGLSGKLYTAGERLNFLFALDYNYAPAFETLINFGNEIEMVFDREYFSLYLRGGHKFVDFEYDESGWAFGSGIKIKYLFIDYSYDFFGNSGENHKISLKMSFGKGDPRNQSKYGDKDYNEAKTLQQAEWYMIKKHYNNALSEYTKVYQHNPNHVKAVYNIAAIYSVLNSMTLAEGWVRCLLGLDDSLIDNIEKDPDFKNFRKTGKYRVILSQYKKEEKPRVYNEAEIMLHAEKFMKTKQYDKAIEEYITVIHHNSGNKKAAYNISSIYAQKFKTKDSVRWIAYTLNLDASLLKEIENDPEFINVKHSQDYKNIKSKYQKPELTAEEKKISGEEENLPPGDKYFKEKQYDNALKEYNKIIKKEPENLHAIYNTAAIYSIVKEMEYTKMWLEYVLKIDRSLLKKVEKDPNFNNFRKTEDYMKILNKYK